MMRDDERRCASDCFAVAYKRENGAGPVMEEVCRFVTRLVQAERRGGRVIVRDAHTVLLYDVSEWGEEHARAVRARFPECDVACMANASSMSGFVVIITRHCHPRAQLWASAFVLALLGAAYSGVRMRGFLQEDAGGI